ncbi:hypothetical protein MA16_Dca021420 [Dendrobium catenatum]|uniref:Uncharacterized protein n=1 Tax=Dendrobium catenatum TaxID=906689 RepID=A0A2I0WJ03_9ASPA|nr:hypothetical protein MA16_Dca021420 [Dendrobium catenatum]
MSLLANQTHHMTRICPVRPTRLCTRLCAIFLTPVHASPCAHATSPPLRPCKLRGLPARPRLARSLAPAYSLQLQPAQSRTTCLATALLRPLT